MHVKWAGKWEKLTCQKDFKTKKAFFRSHIFNQININDDNLTEEEEKKCFKTIYIKTHCQKKKRMML